MYAALSGLLLLSAGEPPPPAEPSHAQRVGEAAFLAFTTSGATPGLTVTVSDIGGGW